MVKKEYRFVMYSDEEFEFLDERISVFAKAGWRVFSFTIVPSYSFNNDGQVQHMNACHILFEHDVD